MASRIRKNRRMTRQATRPAATSSAAGSENRRKPRHKPDPQIDLAQAAWAKGHFEDAIRLYEQALARDPGNPVLMVDVARAYALRYRFEDAEKLINRANALHDSDADFQCMLARSYEHLQHYDQALACYQRALEREPQSPDRFRSFLAMARILERLHRLDESRQCASRILERFPQFDEAQLILATIDRREKHLEAARQRFEALACGKDTSPAVASQSWYALAAIHDKAGDADAAFDALTKAKDILNQAATSVRRDAAVIAQRHQLMYDSITPEHFKNWQAAGHDLKPLPSNMAMLIGHPRSGTTLLEQVLDSHPDLISADELKIMSESVFGALISPWPRMSIPAALERATIREIETTRTTYWRQVQGALRQGIGPRTLLDKNPELTNILPAICRAFPEIKVIFALRDPRDVVLSCFFQDLPLNPVSVQYLCIEETASKYAATMRFWLKMKDMLQVEWTIARYEDSVADLEGQARRVLSFLDLDWNEDVLRYDQHAREKHVHSPTYEAVTKPVYRSSIGRWKNYEKYLEPAMPILKPFVEAFGYA